MFFKTYEEAAEAFPIGCEVEFIEKDSFFNFNVGDKFTVVSYSKQYGNIYINVNDKDGMWFCFLAYSIKLVNKENSILISACPRCKQNLTTKFSEILKEDIQKCPNCGWC